MNEKPNELEQLEALLQLAPCGVGLFEIDSGEMIFVNRAYCGLLGFTPEEYRKFHAKNPLKNLLPADISAKYLSADEFQETGCAQDYEYRIIRQDKTVIWLKMSASTVTVAGKAYAFASFLDITKEKETALQLTLIAENLGSSLSLIRVTEAHEELIYANDAFFHTIGIDRTRYRENMPLYDRSVVSPEDHEKIQHAAKAALASGQPGEVTHCLLRPDGKKLWLHRRFAAIQQDSPDTYLLVSIVTDITEKMEAELQAALEQRRFQTVIRELNAAVFEWDLKAKRFYSSEAYQNYAISAVSNEDILNNRGPADIVHPDDREIIQQFFQQTAAGNPHVEVVLRLKMMDGTYHWCRMLGFYYRDTDGTPSHTVGVLIDINEEQERSFMLNSLLNEIPGGVAIFSFADTLQCRYFSDGFALMSGRTRQELDQLLHEGTLLKTVIVPADYDHFLCAVHERSVQGLPINLTSRYLLKDNSIGWFHLSAAKMREEDGQAVYYCVFTTPTDETALYRSVVEESAIGVFVAERATRSTLYVNTAAARMFGLPPNTKATGRPVLKLLQELGAAPVLTQEDVLSLKPEEYSEFHAEVNGRYLAAKAKALTWNGVDAYILYMADETTEHAHQLQLQKLVDEVPTGIGIYEVEDGQICLTYLNDAYYDLVGMTRESQQQYYGKHALEAVHPEDQASFLALTEQLLAGADKGKVLARLRTRDNAWMWMNLAVSVVERRENRLRIYAAFSDCDEIIRTHQEMEKTQIRERTLMASIPGGAVVYRIKKDGRIVAEYVSEGFARLTGYTAAECEACPDVRANVVPSDLPTVLQTIHDAAIEQKPINITYRIRSKDRQDIMVQLDASVMSRAECHADDAAVLYAVHTRVSEESRRALLEQQHYRTILNMTGIAYFEWDRSSGFYCSESYHEYALSAGGFDAIMGGRSGIDAIYPEDLPKLQAYMLQAESKVQTSVTVRMKMRSGSYRWTDVIGYLERDANGTFSRLSGVLRDVDQEWIEQNKQLQAALDEAKKANRAKTDFLSRVSHDMRTPLNGILGITSLLKNYVTDPQTLKDVCQMELSGQYLLNLINDTLDMSRIESGRLELHPAVCDGRLVFNNILGLARPNIAAKKIQFHVHAGNLPFTMLYIDVGRVEQIVMNIIGNAVKFTPENGIIEFTMENLSVKDGIITDRISIRDNGIGMDASFLPRLFEPFSQADTSKTNTTKGTGLGMAITKQLVMLMGGDISVTSEPGNGTCFTVILPMQIATEEQIDAWKREQHTGVDDTLLKGKRILLCEDHPVNVEVATRLLKAKGMLVEHAANGKLGVDLFQSSEPDYYDAILMDIRMPVMDGMEAARTIRALPRADAQRVPIIAMTANAFDDDVRQSSSAGMNVHLSKPIDPGKLYDALEQQMHLDCRLQRPAVLIVDDVELNRTIIRMAIEKDYELFEAVCGEDALRVLEQHHIDAVITDIQMPGMDGIELIRRIRENPAYRHIAIVANTQYGESEQEEQLLALGANDFIYKPTTPKIVEIRVRNALRKI